MAAIRRGAEAADAVFHVGAVYKVGIPKSEHAAMHDANVRGTERVLDTAIDAEVARRATDAKARSQLGFQPRDLDTGLRQTIETA